MDEAAFQRWLQAYREAWEQGDVDRAVTLFTADAEYYETPFDAPMVGSAAIAEYWTTGAAEGQREVRVTFTILSTRESSGLAHWHTTFTRVPSGQHVVLDGILLADFAPSGRCARFREWWHRTEGP